MLRYKRILVFGVLLAALAGALLMFVPALNPVRADKDDTTAIEGAGALDGMVFASDLGPLGMPANVEDFLVFEDGLFVSKECERRCGYAPAPYFVRRVGADTEFISETSCLDKDATIVWRGTVDAENGTIEGKFTWTSERWYWSIEKEFWFEGKFADLDIPVASGR